MIWPEKPTCHSVDPVFRYANQDIVWRQFAGSGWGEGEPKSHPDDPYRTCSYCGSMHPEDLLAALTQGARLGGSDWKYGFPHKFYVYDIPSPDPTGDYVISASYSTDVDGNERREYQYGKRPTLISKFYTQHLEDQGYDDEALTLLLETLTRHSGITWKRNDEGRIVYQAPYHGYQR
jgi:hypothetical protein